MEQANAVIQALRKWDLEGHVIGQCFETTASNTGHENGAAVIVERFMKKKLLWLACRHHVYEMILKQVISEIFGCTSAPVNTKFVAFQREWNTIDKSQEMRSLPITCLWLQIRRDQVIAVISEMLSDKKSFLRDDYRELAQLSIILLGGEINCVIRKPGGVSHARWMSSILYYTKMYIFSDQLNFSDEFLCQLTRFLTFVTLFYSVPWLECSLACNAAVNDLTLYKDMLRYKHSDTDVAGAVLKALDRHQWYLVPELAVFSLCCDRLSSSEKEAIAEKLLENPVPQRFPAGKPSFPHCKYTMETQVSSLITHRSWLVFHRLGVDDTHWLHLPSSEWKTNDHFKIFDAFVHQVKVVNDPAERAVQMISEYASKVTQDEEQRQWMLQCVEDSRKSNPVFSKAAYK